MSHIRKVAYISLTPSLKVAQLVQYKQLTPTHLNPQNFNLIFLITLQFSQQCSITTIVIASSAKVN